MPTIIDSLVVRLGLDSKPLDQEAPKAVKQFNNVEKAAASLLGLLGGLAALRHFAEELINSNAALERFSKNIGVSVQTVSAWGNAVEEFGGNAKSVQGTLDMLSKAQTEFRLTGESSLIPFFSMLSVNLGAFGKQMRPVDEILLDLSDRFSKMDRTTANNIGRMMGIDQDTLNLLLRGRSEVEATIRRQKDQNAVTKEQAEQSVRLQRQLIGLRQSFVAFGQSLLQQAGPALEKMLATLLSFGDWVRNNSEFVGDFLKVLGVGLGAIAIASLPLTGTVAIIGALAAGIALLWDDYQTWKKGGDSLIDWSKWEPGINLAIAGLKMLRDIAEETFGALRSVGTFWADKFKGNNGAASQESAKLQNRIRGWVGASQKAVPTDDEAAKLNRPKAFSSGEIKSYFEARGWSSAQAAGIAANIISESNGRTDATGDNGAALGLGQWHKDRQANFEKWAGHSMKLSTGKEQLEFYQHELMTTEKGAGDKLRSSVSPVDAGGIVSRYFERPGDADGEAARRGKLAAMYAGMPNAASSLAQAGGNGGTVVDRSVSNRIDNLTIQTQATDAPGIMRGMRDAMDNLTFASQANPGLN